ncbi:hypothetical protein AC781_06300 [Akkermansia glycaniphila]|nr:hypothetical protein AC781_06300 [Akkermansia glycaniphila]
MPDALREVKHQSVQRGAERNAEQHLLTINQNTIRQEQTAIATSHAEPPHAPDCRRTCGICLEKPCKNHH